MSVNRSRVGCLLKLVRIISLLTFTFGSVLTDINLFLKKDEVLKLLGLNAELYYIKERKVNDYALRFVVPVPPNISDLDFTWQSLIPTPMPYSIALSVNDITAIGTPTINITRKGNVPMKEQVFRIVLPCTGKVNAEVDVNIYINITMSPSSNVTQLTLKRKKICLKGLPQTSTDEPETVLTNTSTLVYTRSSFYFTVALCSIIFTLVLGLLALVCYVRSHKTAGTDMANAYAGVSSHLSSGKPGQTFLRVDTPNNNGSTMSKTGSQYSSFRRLTTPSSLHRSLIGTNTAVQTSEYQYYRLSDQIEELAVDRRKILLQEKLQEGTFAQIYTGIYLEDSSLDLNSEEPVIIKTVSNQASKMQVSLFVTEGLSMFGLNNRHILNVIAACIEDPQKPLLVYPLMNRGNLKLFLQKCKFSAEGQVHTLVTQDLVSMTVQIVQGMIYLHNNKIIHKDLATRNCAVTSADDGYSLLVKITDNALSRDLFPNDYHCLGDNENRPVKWLAIESLLKKEFHQYSDVWAFGVTLWELMTLGQQPYFEVDPFEMGAYLRDGYRLFQPINCPDNLYEIMVCCWNAIPEERPTFHELLNFLQDFYTALTDYV